ncbi:MAG TPA: hypothetical protein VK116_16690 [Planctomycetota bacterium]|nr:hypothetical protein [Planctomycetota bacterium]
MVESTVERSLGTLRSRKTSLGAPSRGALFAWGALGAILVVLSILFAGRISFWLFFQRPLETFEPDRIAWWSPQIEPETEAGTWDRFEIAGWEIALPARVRAVAREGDSIVLELDGGRVVVDIFASGFLRSLVEAEEAQVGRVEGISRSDPELLREIATEHLARYRFGWDDAERSLYALRLLVKLLVWDDRPVDRFVLSAEKEGLAATLVRSSSGESRVTVATHGGVCVIAIPKSSPPEWTERLAPWTGTRPLGKPSDG